MESASTIANTLNNLVGQIGGSICFWGMWFGRPMDNWHQLTGAQAIDNCLRLKFDQGEELAVTSPGGFELSGRGFKIRQAKKVIWSWFYHGKSKTLDHEFIWLFEDVGSAIEFQTSWPMQVTEPPKRSCFAVVLA
jgi:hypothetical protein